MQKKRLLPLIAVLSITVLIGTALATNGWFTFIFDYTPPGTPNEHLYEDVFDLEVEPEVPDYVSASCTITGSGYIGLEHDVKTTVRHWRWTDEYNYFGLSADYDLYLHDGTSTIEIIDSGSFSDFEGGSPPDGGAIDFLSLWTPSATAGSYTIKLDVTGEVWTEHHICTFDSTETIYDLTRVQVGAGQISSNSFDAASYEAGVDTVSLSFQCGIIGGSTPSTLSYAIEILLDGETTWVEVVTDTLITDSVEIGTPYDVVATFIAPAITGHYTATIYLISA